MLLLRKSTQDYLTRSFAKAGQLALIRDAGWCFGEVEKTKLVHGKGLMTPIIKSLLRSTCNLVQLCRAFPWLKGNQLDMHFKGNPCLQKKPLPRKALSGWTSGGTWTQRRLLWSGQGLIVTFNTDWSRKHIQVPKICGDNSETCSGPNCFSSAFEGFLSRCFWVYVIKMTKDWSLLDCQVHEVVHHFSLVVYKSPKSP